MPARRAVPALLLPLLAAGSLGAQEPEPLPATGAVEPAPVPAEVVRVVERPNTAGLAVRELPASLTREEMARIQAGLAAAGFHPGRQSGALDRQTAEALLAFQKRRGLAPCGCPTVETVEALGIPILHVVQLSYAQPATPEPRRPPREAEAEADGGGSYGERPMDYWYPVLLHQRVEFEPPEDGGEGGPPPSVAPPPRGARPPGVRPAPPPDGRTFPRGR